MSELTKEQIERLKLIVGYEVATEMLGDDAVALDALLDAYEERGREIERLRAIKHEAVLAFDQAVREAEQAEARLEKVVEAVEQAEADVCNFGFEVAHPAVTMRLNRLIRKIRGLAAAQPEKKS